MSPRYLTLLAAFLACAPLSHAVRPRPEDAAESDAPAKTGVSAKVKGKDDASATADASAKADSVPPYELKNRSAFTATDAKSRAPFWPIGWVKRVAVAAAVPEAPPEPKVDLDQKSFALTSILLGSGATPSLAVINHRAYSEGEFLHMPKNPGTAPVRVRVQRIADGVVTLQHGTQTLVIALQRTELSSRRTEEQYLDPDR